MGQVKIDKIPAFGFAAVLILGISPIGVLTLQGAPVTSKEAKPDAGLPQPAFRTVGPFHSGYQKESIELAKKLLPPNGNKVKNVKVRQAGDDLWITVQASEAAGQPRRRWVYEFHRAKDKKPVLFYRHARTIDVIPTHGGRSLLINAYPVTQRCYVVMADLQTGKDRRIDLGAVDAYIKKLISTGGAKSDGFYPVFSAVEISPDDKQVLLKLMDTQEDVPDHRFEAWYCSVDSSSGKIIKDFKTSRPYAPWWR